MNKVCFGGSIRIIVLRFNKGNFGVNDSKSKQITLKPATDKGFRTYGLGFNFNPKPQ